MQGAVVRRPHTPRTPWREASSVDRGRFGTIQPLGPVLPGGPQLFPPIGDRRIAEAGEPQPLCRGLPIIPRLMTDSRNSLQDAALSRGRTIEDATLSNSCFDRPRYPYSSRESTAGSGLIWVVAIVVI